MEKSSTKETLSFHMNDGKPQGLCFERLFVNEGEDPTELVSWETSDAEIRDWRTGNISFAQKDVEHPVHLNQNQVNVVSHHYLRGSGENREKSLRQAFRRVAKTIASWGRSRIEDPEKSDMVYDPHTDVFRASYPGEAMDTSKGGGGEVRIPKRMEDGTYQLGHVIKKPLFSSDEDRQVFEDELLYLLTSGRAAFNSPVWYNVGINPAPQCSACFILSLDDSMEGIRHWIERESKIFQGGSGSGLNVSALRGSIEFISGSPNKSSGPMEFMRWADSGAGAIKSGGKTRRAAKMVVMDVDHPDIIDFVVAKKETEDMARALKREGYSGGITGDIYKNLPFQNANQSVRVTDEFMRAVKNGSWWGLRARTTAWDRDSRTVLTVDGNVQFKGADAFDNVPGLQEFGDDITTALPARYLWRLICDCAWDCGDPGLQFDTTINTWNTALKVARINASNPCSEYMFHDDTSCNLASINLLKYIDPETGEFDVDSYLHTVRIIITAQELLVDMASYPSIEIHEGTRNSRTLGIGHANLGAMLMALGIPYDSEKARYMAGAITCAMTGVGYAVSSKIAEIHGPYKLFKEDPESMYKVLALHKDRAAALLRPSSEGHGDAPLWTKSLIAAGMEGYSTAKDSPGVRNAQISVMAPTGTISFVMGCDTTGVEPGISIISYKNLVGGGTLRQVLGCAEAGLHALGYDSETVSELIAAVVDDEMDLQQLLIDNGASEDEVRVFDCALESSTGRAIQPLGHLKMMAAIQPFVSGAISKTVNCPADWTKEQIADLYMKSWEMGLKAIAIYRDGCKTAQPVTTKKESDLEAADANPSVRVPLGPIRHNTTQIKIDINFGGFTFYAFIGRDENGKPREVFFVGKEGSTLGGMLGGLGRVLSIGLQHGVPLEAFLETLAYSAFAPAGMTGHDVVKICKSPLDAFARILAVEEGILLPGGDWSKVGPDVPEQLEAGALQAAAASLRKTRAFEGTVCSECGSSNMVPNGACMRCMDCGATTGCG